MGEVIYWLDVDPSLDPSPVLPALIWAEGIAAPRPTEETPAFLTEILTEAAVAREEFVPAALRDLGLGQLCHITCYFTA